MGVQDNQEVQTGNGHARGPASPSYSLELSSPRVGPQVVTTRNPSTQIAFDEIHLSQPDEDKPSLCEKIKDSLRCSKRRLWKLLVTYIPLIKFVRYYHPRHGLVPDLVGGLSVGTLHIPQALAFGLLASVKIENGLYTSLWPVLIYVFFGTSAHVSMGTSAVICILTAATIDREALAWAHDKPWIMNQTVNGTKLDEVPEYLDFKEELSMAISLITGIIMIAMGFLKLGFITAYLSDSFFAGFTSAAAVHIGTSQLPAILGIKIAKFAGIGKIVKTYIAIIEEIHNINWAALIIALICGFVIWFVKDCVNERFKSKLPAPIPIELFIVIAGTLASYFGNFKEEFGIKVVGVVPTGFSPPYVPMEGLKLAPSYIVDAFVMAILIFAYTIAIAKICAKKHNYEIDDSQELLAYGLCNAGSSFLRCFPSCVAPPRSMVASSMNVASVLNGIASSALIFVIIMILVRFVTDLPSAVLAAIIAVALQKLFIQIMDFRKYWRVNKFDFVIWFFTFFPTVFLDIDIGLGIGVGVSLITVVFQTQFARGFKIGYTKTDPTPVEHKKYKDSSEVPGIKVFRFQSNLYFANAEIFRNTLYRCTVNPRKLLKALKKREKRLEKMNKQRVAAGLAPKVDNNFIMKGSPETPEVPEMTKSLSAPDLSALAAPPTVFTFLDEVGKEMHETQTQNVTSTVLSTIDELGTENINLASLDLAMPPKEPTIEPASIVIEDTLPPLPAVRRVRLPSVDRPPFIILHGNAPLFLDDTGVHTRFEDVNTARQNTSFQEGRLKHSESAISLYSINFDDYTEDPDDGDELISDEKIRRMRRIHHVIIDCSPINYLDCSGANVLMHIFTEYSHVNIQLYLASCNADMRRTMTQAGVFDRIPQENVFVDVQDAVVFAKPQRPLPIKPEDLEVFSDEEAIEESHIINI